MRMWIAVCLASMAASPAFALENVDDCQIEETRRGAPTRVAPPAAPVPQTTHMPPREAAGPQPNLELRAEAPRRRGKRVPDAELIEPRGAL